jgi:hypothetical protein
MKSNLWLQKANQWLPGMGLEDREGGKEIWQNLRAMNVYYLDCGDGFMGICMCPIWPNHIF